MLHVTNGDCAAALIRASGVGEDVLPWRDVLHEGPVPAGLDLDELSQLRAEFLAGQGWGTLQQARESLAERNAMLAECNEHDEVVLWFEHDLYDQLQLIQLIDWFAPRRTVLSLICVDRFPGIERFTGLGLLDPAQTASLFPMKRSLTEDQLALGRAAWNAFRSADPSAITDLLGSDTSALPFLAAALHRHIEQFPSTQNGLGRTEQQILDNLGPDPRRAAELFRADHRQESSPFLGNATFFSYLSRLATGPHPLVVLDAAPVSGDRIVTMTADGRAVLENRADAIALNGIDRWWGGVHQRGSEVLWRRDPGSRVLVRTGV